MSSVDIDPTTTMALEQAATALSSAVLSAAGIGATPSSPTSVDPSTVTPGVDVVFLTEYTAGAAGIVISEELASALTESDGSDGDLWTALGSMAELGAQSVTERVNGLVDGLGDLVTVRPQPDGLRELESGTMLRVDVEGESGPIGWLMWVGSSSLVDALTARGADAAVIDAIDYPDLGPGADADEAGADISFLSDVTMGVTVELGRTTMRVREVLQLTQGSVVELDRAAGALVDVLISGSVVARGEVVVIDDQLGVRVVEIVDSASATR